MGLGALSTTPVDRSTGLRRPGPGRCTGPSVGCGRPVAGRPARSPALEQPAEPARQRDARTSLACPPQSASGDHRRGAGGRVPTDGAVLEVALPTAGHRSLVSLFGWVDTSASPLAYY